MLKLYARGDKSKKQALSDHLNNVADMSSEFSFCGSLSRLTGSLHDFGKATADFLGYFENGGARGSVVHALQGAFFVDEFYCDPNDIAGILVKEITSIAIANHHGSLSDGISPDGESVFLHKLTDKENVKYNYQESKRNIASIEHELKHSFMDTFNSAKSEVHTILDKIKRTYKSKESAQYALGLLTKFIYSCLIDADRLDAYQFDTEDYSTHDAVDWNRLTSAFELNLKKRNDGSEIASIRQAVSDKCKDAATKGTGIYLLSVPTGGGKTLSSFRFALHTCKNKKRIIYVIPYLSIIEQTVSEIQAILGLDNINDIILEHHSGIVAPENEDKQELRKLSTSRWDRPIIITTMVQFLETVMSARGSDLRKFHNMSDSVIIFDEIQSLPVKTVHLFNETVTFLSKFCNSSILLCTATQPLLDKTERHNLLLDTNPYLIDCVDLFNNLKRTEIVSEKEKDIDAFSTLISEKAELEGNCLAIFNTRQSAREAYYRIKDIYGFTVYHLSTSMCSAHRAATIDKIRAALDTNKNIICVSTQLIEAGIDISFSCVIRASAGLDSVIQAAGRCNRNGRSDQPKKVYVISLKNESLDKLEDIKTGRDITNRLIRENENDDLSNPELLKQFYKQYFYDRRRYMDYPTNAEESVYEMLSLNKAGVLNYRNRTSQNCSSLIAHAFQSADENFCVIDKKGKSVVVPYGEAENLIEQYTSQPKGVITKTKFDIIKQLEKYSVQLYTWEIEKLGSAISVMDDETGILILNKLHYKDTLGVVYDTDPTDYIC